MTKTGTGRLKVRKAQLQLYLVLLLSLSITAIFLLPFCNWMYKCGCAVLWGGGADLCNVHRPGVPHCPWCVARKPALMAAHFIALFAGQAGAIYAFRKKYGLAEVWLLVAGVLVFCGLAVVDGFIFKILDRYPYFFI